MNHEPIQFLPVAPFWKAADHAHRKAQRAFITGLIVGTAGTFLVALLLSLITRPS